MQCCFALFIDIGGGVGGRAEEIGCLSVGISHVEECESRSGNILQVSVTPKGDNWAPQSIEALMTRCNAVPVHPPTVAKAPHHGGAPKPRYNKGHHRGRHPSGMISTLGKINNVLSPATKVATNFTRSRIRNPMDGVQKQVHNQQVLERHTLEFKHTGYIVS